MVWGVIYHPEVQKDLDQLGAVAANRILDVIEGTNHQRGAGQERQTLESKSCRLQADSDWRHADCLSS